MVNCNADEVTEWELLLFYAVAVTCFVLSGSCQPWKKLSIAPVNWIEIVQFLMLSSLNENVDAL